MKLKTAQPKTDNINDLLCRIVDFTDHRKAILTRNLFDYRTAGFEPLDLPVCEFASAMTCALAEHLHHRRLVVQDSDHLKFGDGGQVAISPVVDSQGKQFLENGQAEIYLNHQLQKLSENLIHQQLAAELLRQKQQRSALLLEDNQ